MTSSQAIQAINKQEAQMEILVSQLGKLEAKASSLELSAETAGTVMGIFTELGDASLGSFCGALSAVANEIIGETFGQGYEVSIKASGTTGMKVVAKDGTLEDVVSESQGEGFVNITSAALLLAALSISPVIRGSFVLMDEPFAGAVQSDRLDVIYEWLSRASKELGLQIVMTTHHEEAIRHADQAIKVGE